MFNSAILEVGIALTLMYSVLSIICSALQESVESWLKVRATDLEHGLRELLHDPDGKGLVSDVYKHPLIFGLFKGNYDPDAVRKNLTTTLPTYIPASNFATALLDIAVHGPMHPEPDQTAPQPVTALSCDTLRAAVVASPALNQSVRRVVLLMIDEAKGDVDKARANLENWFNNGMDRVSGWYKRRAQWISLFLALLIAVLLNVDTCRVATELYKHEGIRAGAVAEAGAVSKDMGAEAAKEAIDRLDGIKLPVGWQEDAMTNKGILDYLSMLFGWLITAFAISLGAPFWFDILNKLMVIRSTVKPREKSPEEASKDKQVAPQESPVEPATAAGAGVSAGGRGAPGAAGASPPDPDEEHGVDACDVTDKDVTPDDELPIAQGGVG